MKSIEEDGFVVTERTDCYEVGIRGELISAECICGAGVLVKNQGLGRAEVGTWKTRHQNCEESK